MLNLNGLRIVEVTKQKLGCNSVELSKLFPFFVLEILLNSREQGQFSSRLNKLNMENIWPLEEVSVLLKICQLA